MSPYCAAAAKAEAGEPLGTELTMKIASSLKSLKRRHKECRIVRRRGRVYVINKRNPRYKARQG